ncbi:hypothetical protein N800_08585 [Lysobacter daejeonensis GH1-9]|uniref:TspB protein n=2 Tax=Aerolutibacter TaxID=3382701 RepID=A0A0A0F4D5_9GAMM|nr:hypothetical protein N800_08585 [Lysobacter daejeonensis GH1-9]
MQPGFETETNQSISDGTTKTVYRGVMEYTGDPCGAVPIDPNWDTPEKNNDIPKQECQQVGTFTMCKKPDGQHCASASNGRQFCWKPGETGEKTDGPVMQKKNAGPTEIPPSLSLPNGDTLQKQGDSVKTTTTTNNSTTTTTTTNYTTVNGTNAGPTNQGESSSGDGSGQEGGQENGLAGGVSCDAPPVATGDPILGSIALQTWKTRCQGEAHKSSGAGDCEALFQCSGDEILCSLAMEKRKERCDYEQRFTADNQALADIAAQPDGTEGLNLSDIHLSVDRGQINENLLGASSGQCDLTFTLAGQSIDFPPEFWTVMAMIKMLIVAMAYMWIARQLGA